MSLRRVNSSLVFTSDASTKAGSMDDPSEIPCKHEHKQNHRFGQQVEFLYLHGYLHTCLSSKKWMMKGLAGGGAGGGDLERIRGFDPTP